MTDANTLKGKLKTATMLVADGKLAQAEAILDALAADPDRDVLGATTALGLPRRLHAAMLKLAKRRGDDRARVALQYHLVPPVDVLGSLFRVDAAGRAERVTAAIDPVPRLLHQIWIGSKPPETTAIWQDHAARHGWEYTLWDEDALAGIGVDKDPVYQAMLADKDFPGAVDVARYHVLAAHGGTYLDCDWVPVGDQPLEAAIPLVGLSAMAENTPRLTGTGSPFLNNSVIAAPPRHPVFTQLLDRLPEVTRRLPKGPAWWVTGPLVFTLACRAGPVTVLDATIASGFTDGGRADVDRTVAAFSANGNPAILHGWKPWDTG